MTHDVTMPLRIENGKFMRGNVEVPPCIGDREQIALLQRLERESVDRERKAKSGWLDVDIEVENIRYDAICSFKCICGNLVTDSLRDIDAYGVDSIDGGGDFDEEIIRCRHCNREYEINGFYAKLITRK